MQNIKRFPSLPAGMALELVFWILAIVLLATVNPHEHHFSLCPLANLGVDWCPGCGLGRSISALLHGEVKESLNFHWFGIPAIAIIVYRITKLSTLTKRKDKEFNLNYKED